MNDVPPLSPLQFRHGRPGESLSPFVRNFWAAESTESRDTCRGQRVVPDGCIDLIFVRRGLTETFNGFVVGTMTRPTVEDVVGGAQYLGVRFAPGGFTGLFGHPAHQFTDRTVALDDLSLSLMPGERFVESPGIEASFRMLEDGLSRHLVRARSSPAVGKALDMISASQGAVTITQLAAAIDYSPRQLLRVFRESVGVGPKTYCRIVRFKDALRALRRRSQPDLLQIALDAGYYDQAHFIHEFNTFYGSSPAAAAMSVPYNTPR